MEVASCANRGSHRADNVQPPICTVDACCMHDVTAHRCMQAGLCMQVHAGACRPVKVYVFALSKPSQYRAR